MKQACIYIGSFILSALFILFPILLGYGIAASWKSIFLFPLCVIVACEIGCIWLWAIAEVTNE